MNTSPARLRPLHFHELEPAEMQRRSAEFLAEMQRRRSVRAFSPRPVPRQLIERAVLTAGTAPSGAHQQPWTFVIVSEPQLKSAIRAAAEEEERRNYSGRMPQEWLDALAPLGTDFVKTHLTTAPWVVVLFRHLHGVGADGDRRTLYYTSESCGLAAGLFIAAVHHMGLATLTHTPSPMGFLGRLLARPANEKAFLVLPVGYPAEDAEVPELERRSLEEISVWR
jgi:iodotyrosine deiodinase